MFPFSTTHLGEERLEAGLDGREVRVQALVRASHKGVHLQAKPSHRKGSEVSVLRFA
jgi:hypothetical protein